MTHVGLAEYTELLRLNRQLFDCRTAAFISHALLSTLALKAQYVVGKAPLPYGCMTATCCQCQCVKGGQFGFVVSD